VESLAAAAALLQSLSMPFLNWTGKAERHQLSVPTLPLFVHERHSTKAIIETVKHRRAEGTTADLFGNAPMDVTDQLDAYEHKGAWEHRMILGDSLHVMNSLLEYEGLGGQVQMIYLDPPYGVKFGSNFQPFVRKRDVRHGDDEDMSREPEMVKAYRDTWELGLHSYLTYLRDRLWLAKELLTPSGSIFVQISDENLHHVREVMDEVFGVGNYIGQIAFRKTGGQSVRLLPSTYDFVLHYARDLSRVRFHPLFVNKDPGEEGAKQYVWIEAPNRTTYRRMTDAEIESPASVPNGWRVLRPGPLTSPGASPNARNEITLQGRTFTPGANRHWSLGPEDTETLDKKQRVLVLGNTPCSKLYLDDFPVSPLKNVWPDTGGSGFAEKPLYVVQTDSLVIQRCVLMTTDPGDLVFDPTCGSGTTAYVAEQWGRRWITCDTSRVPLALARQRLLTAVFLWYELKTPGLGPEGGFDYQRKQNRKGEEVGGLVPHVTLKSIANSEPPKMEVLVDRPEVRKDVTRVAGRFTVEATIPAAQQVGELVPAPAPDAAQAQSHVDRMIEVLRRSQTLRLPGNRTLNLSQIRALSGCEFLHAEASNGAIEKRVAVLFGPPDGAIVSQTVLEAAREARQLGFAHLYIFGFAIQAKARELVENAGKLKLPASYVTVTPDVVMSDLLKTSRHSEIFSVTGLPDVDVKWVKGKQGEQQAQVTLKGLDLFNPDTLEHEPIEGQSLPCWMLDADYNGLCFYATQVFFPKTAAWDNLKKSLGAHLEATVWDHLAGTTSEPFVPGKNRRIAVKVIDERGNELMVVKDLKP
jgi:adenine-specific DNA-methyltransferase